MDLVTRCTNETCHTSIPLPIFEESQNDDIQLSARLWTEFCGSSFPADQQCFSKYNLVKTKKCTFPLQFHPFSPKFLREPQEEEQRKKADTYTASTPYWLWDVTYHSLDTYQNWRCIIDNRNSRHVWIKTTLRCSHKLPNPKLIFE